MIARAQSQALQKQKQEEMDARRKAAGMNWQPPDAAGAGGIFGDSQVDNLSRLARKRKHERGGADPKHDRAMAAVAGQGVAGAAAAAAASAAPILGP